ncbi:MAG: hypothetical protein ACLU9S_00155 [Oscillospiraceae bacterium]
MRSACSDRVDGDGVVTQWLGDGCCAFPLHGLPVLSEPELYRMFDVSEKKQDKIYFNHSALPEGLNVEDWCRSEVRAEDMDVTISSGGKVLMPLRFPGGLLFIQSKYLGPLEDQMDFLELYVRRSDSGGRYVVAKTGMLVAGVIFPVQAVNEGFCDKLEELASLTRRELDRHLSVPPVAEEEYKDQENVFRRQRWGNVSGQCRPSTERTSPSTPSGDFWTGGKQSTGRKATVS